MSSCLDVPTFVARWQRSTLTERSAAQQHFLDLCAVLGEPTPATADPDSISYTFGKDAQTDGGEAGWVDEQQAIALKWAWSIITFIVTIIESAIVEQYWIWRVRMLLGATAHLGLTEGATNAG